MSKEYSIESIEQLKSKSFVAYKSTASERSKLDKLEENSLFLGVLEVWSIDIFGTTSRISDHHEFDYIEKTLNDLALASNHILSEWLVANGEDYHCLRLYIESVELLREAILGYISSF